MSASTARRKANESANKKLRRSWRAVKGKWPLRDKKYLEWVRTLRCHCCVADWLQQVKRTEAAHVGLRGLSQKCSDRETIPLCARHHREGNLSAHTLQREFWKYWKLDRDTLVAGLNQKYEEQKAA